MQLDEGKERKELDGLWGGRGGGGITLTLILKVVENAIFSGRPIFLNCSINFLLRFVINTITKNTFELEFKYFAAFLKFNYLIKQGHGRNCYNIYPPVHVFCHQL